MTTGYQIIEQDKCYFLTLTVVNWIDIFSRVIYKDLIIENLRYCQENKGLEIFGYVIMTNHIHLIVRSSKNNLSGTLRDFKSYTSKQILKTINDHPESRRSWMLPLFRKSALKIADHSKLNFWQHGNHAKIIYSSSFLSEKLNYIHENPVRAGIVESAEHYKYSSAGFYANGYGVLKVDTVIQEWITK